MHVKKGKSAETTVRRIVFTAWAVLAFCCFFLWAEAAADQIGVFRIRPAVESADVQREDGAAFIGTARGKQCTAQLWLEAEGRSPEGNTWNLPELLKNRKGRILYAFWRLEAAGVPAEGEEYLLWPAGNREASLVRTASEGSNLWDVTAWTEDLLSRKEFSFRMQLLDGASGEGADFDFSRSRIYVTVRLEEEEPALETDLLTDSALLDAALSALPADHWALKRYQEITGSLVQARWPETGVPYYFGGHSEEKILQRYHPSQPSRYYKSNQLYLNGFDCSSFLRWAEEKAGYVPMESLDEVLPARVKYFPLSGIPAADWGKILRPGDYLLFEHGTNHVGMILGTPRQLGLTAEDVPELADHLDDPLMIHCGEDPFVYDRFREWIEAQHFRKATTPPDGGVTVSLLLPSAGDAAHLRQAPWGKEYGYFEAFGQTVTVYPLDSQTRIAWYCPVTQ